MKNNKYNYLNVIQQNTGQRWEDVSEYARNWLKENEIRIKTVTVQDGNYNPHFIYMNRIANCSKPKFRILQRNKDKVKNCILITFNTETVDREYLCYLIQSKLKLFSFCSHGSCHSFINHDIVARIISGATGNNGIDRKEVLY